MIRAAPSISATCLFVALAAASPAAAGTFDVKGAEIAKGESEVALNTTYFGGYPVNAERLRFSAELGVSHGFSDWWKAGLKMALDQEVGHDLEASSVGVEWQALVRKGGDRAPVVAWYVSVDMGLPKDATNVFTFGPLWQWTLDERTSLTVNTLFQRTFGDNQEKGVDFTYAWQVKHEVREGFAIGVEGYGLLPDIGDLPGSSFQEHRIGPVLYFERSFAGRNGADKVGQLSMKDAKKPDAAEGKDDEGPKLNIEAGVLFGFTDATQDRAFKLKGAITF